MDDGLTQILVSSSIAGAFGIVTAWLTAKLSFASERRKFLLEADEERRRWKRDFAQSYAEAASTSPSLARALRQQLAGAYLQFSSQDNVHSERSFIPSSGRLIIGRAVDSDIPINDASLSRAHAAIEMIDQEVLLTDLGSAGGTFINGDRVSKPTILADGVELRFGEVKARLHLMTKAPDPP